jgi:hypothetical protein
VLLLCGDRKGALAGGRGSHVLLALGAAAAGASCGSSPASISPASVVLPVHDALGGLSLG